MTIRPHVDLTLIQIFIEMLATVAFALSGLLRALALVTGFQLPEWSPGKTKR